MPHAPLADLVRASLSTAGPQVLKHLASWQIAELVRLLPELVHSVAEGSGERFSIPSPAWGDPDQGQARFFEALILFLQSLARQNPLFLALEDLQWASDSTLTWLHFFARRLHQVPILFLVTFRSDEVGTEHPLYRMMLDLEQKGLSARLELTRLPLTALAIWMMGVSDSFVARLHRQTEGNPFFTLETVRALVEDGRLHRIGERWTDDPALADLPVPTSISQVIHSRLGRLLSPAREAVATAAVMGRTFDFDVLVQALGWGEEAALTALDELLRCRLIREASGSAREDYEFDHHLVQEVIYQGLHYRQRRRLHRLVGQAMEREYADRPGVAGELAHHLERALEKTQALRYLLQAAHDAAVLFAHDEARGYWKRAFSIVASLRRSEAAAFRESIGNALIARAELYHLQGCLQERAADLRRLRQLAEQAADAPLLDQALIREAHYLNLDGQYAQAIEKARAAAVRCRDRGDADGESQALAEWGFAHYFLGEYNAAMHVLNTALALEHLAPVVRGQVLSVLSYAHYLIADYPRSLDYRQQALAIRRALGQQTRVAEDLTDMGILYTRVNQLPQGEQYLLDALKLAREIGSQVAESYALNQLGILHYVRGDHSAALKCHADSLALQRATGSRRGEASAVNNVGIVHLALGDYAAAEAELREALAIYEEIAYARGVVKALVHLARVLAVLERRADALTAVTRALALAKSIGDRYGQTTALVILAQLHLAENEPTPALTFAREAVALAQEINLTSGYIVGLSLLALGYLTSGDAQTAEQYSAQAVTRLREQGCIEGSEEEIYLTHYRILSALGKDEQAAAALQQARAEVVRKAERLKDESLRRRFREEVPTNREIMTAYRAAVSC